MKSKIIGCTMFVVTVLLIWPPTMARAETTIAQFDELNQKQQGTLIEAVIQNFVDNLQNENRDGAAQCIVQLYTNPLSGSKIGLSAGMEEFSRVLTKARRTDPKKNTIERIIIYQAGKHCSQK